MLARFQTPQRVLALALFISLSISLLLTFSKAPSGDEGILAMVSSSLLNRGELGITALEPASYGNTLGGNLEHYTYWQMPVQFLLEAVVFRFTGYGLTPARLVSIAFSLLLLFCFYIVLSKLFARPLFASFATLLLASDYFFAQSAALARNDVIAAAFFFAALAAHLSWYESAPTRALLVTHTALALAGLTHPVAGIVGLFCLVPLYLYFRVERPIQLRYALAVMLPYLLFGSLYLLYILQAPELFRAQFLGNASGRTRDVFRLADAFVNEVTQRYLPVFWGRANLTPLAKLRLLMLVAYLGGLLGCWFIPSLRRQRPVAVMLWLTFAVLVYLVFLDSTKQRTYFIYIIPFYVALFAVLFDWLWSIPRLPKSVLSIALTGFVLFHIASSCYRFHLQELNNNFYAATKLVQSLRQPSSHVVALVKFSFGLGDQPGALLDDPLYGCENGKIPDIAIRELELDMITDVQSSTPERRACVERVFRDELMLKASFGDYSVYVRKPKP